jgi:glycosyltransferase involved in cell wall biosynthesis
VNLLYIATCDINADGYLGVKKKINNQLKVFHNKYTTYLFTQKNSMYYFYREQELLEKKVLLTSADVYEFINQIIKKNSIECIYIRYIHSNKWFVDFLKINKNLKIILEFPTIPYDEEYKGSIELEEDLRYRRKLKKYVSMTSNYNGLKSVYGIPSIPLNNGIDLTDIPIKKSLKSDNITLIAVATMSFWHGYDRLIKGLANYYAEQFNTKVYLKLVGNGSEIIKYKNLVEQLSLQNYVEFKGALNGQALNEEFDNADIAVGTLGMFRNNANEASPIKTKEYCARAIPIILGHKDLAFEDDLSFIYREKNDDTDININNIIQFYNHFLNSSSHNEIRSYAEERLTWDNILVPVIEFYKQN